MIQSLSAEALSCIRGQRLVFRDLSFSLQKGEVLAVEGANGAGKTSLLRMLAGFLAPAGGEIRLQADNGNIGDAEERGKFVGWLGHHDAVKPQMTPRETLRFFMRLYSRSTFLPRESGGGVREADGGGMVLSDGPRTPSASLALGTSPVTTGEEMIALALEATGLSRIADLPVQYLSAGQKKRLALARLKLSNRSLWLLDEPLAALDANGKTLVAKLIAEHCASGGMAIAATHEPLGLDCARLALA